jgi:hypothetical protein
LTWRPHLISPAKPIKDVAIRLDKIKSMGVPRKKDGTADVRILCRRPARRIIASIKPAAVPRVYTIDWINV